MFLLLPFGLLALFAVLYTIFLIVTRLFLSPVAKIPGPNLAALSFWYEFYYDVILRGRYTWKIAQLHEKYGPVVRINPFEVHINDPDFYDELYVSASKRRTEQWSWSVEMFGTPDSIVATVDHDVHRRRRNAYANYFSKQSIQKYSAVIQAAVDQLCNRCEEMTQAGKKINLMHAYTAMAGDVVSEYCFPQSYGLLAQPDFAPDFYELWMSVLGMSHILKQFPWLFPLMLKFPEWFVDRYVPDLAITYKWHRQWRKQILDVKSGAAIDQTEKRGGRPSMFETLLDSELPPYDKSVGRLVQDAQTMVGAGSATTSFSLALGTYYILSDPSVLGKLMEELETAMPSATYEPLSLVELEKLEYLEAIRLEILRISHGVMHRLQRVCPNQAIQYRDHTIPPGTPISMSSAMIHNDPSIFPDPRTFKPERWLPLDTTGARLQKYLVSFSRGSRQCIGMHLGSAEIVMGIAGLFRRFGRRMEIVDTVKERDVEITHDFFTGMTEKESKGIMMRIRPEN